MMVGKGLVGSNRYLVSLDSVAITRPSAYIGSLAHRSDELRTPGVDKIERQHR